MSQDLQKAVIKQGCKSFGDDGLSRCTRITSWWIVWSFRRRYPTGIDVAVLLVMRVVAHLAEYGGATGRVALADEVGGEALDLIVGG